MCILLSSGIRMTFVALFSCVFVLYITNTLGNKIFTAKRIMIECRVIYLPILFHILDYYPILSFGHEKMCL